MSDKLTQCRLKKGNTEQVAWINKGAQVGKWVKPKGENEFWEVVEVFSTLDKEVLEEQQKGKRTQGASLK